MMSAEFWWIKIGSAVNESLDRLTDPILYPKTKMAAVRKRDAAKEPGNL